jgi:orotate phosphoribosyltransferase
MDEKKRQLLKLLKEKSYRYSPDKPFTLSSGRESPYYVDCRPVTHSAQGLALIGEIFFEALKGLDIQAIGGLTMGADPIAHAVALTSYLNGKPINSFSVRKESKQHGTGGLLVGDIQPGDRVVIVEDVISSGSSVLYAIKSSVNFGLNIVKVLAIVDREEGGRNKIEKFVSDIESLFTLFEIA